MILNTKVKCAEIQHQYDFVINCTYTDPDDSYDIDTKAELAILLVCKSDESWHNKAITIMDGPFCSIYPGNPGHHTISSVVFTPAIKANHPEILKKISTQLSDDEWEKIENDIWNHASSFVNLTGLQKVGRYQIIKTKLQNDTNDFRGTMVLQKDNLLTVLGGKISGAYLAIDQIQERLK